MSKPWTYLTIEVKQTFFGTPKPADLQAELNRQGALGWELVSVIQRAPLAPTLLFFKKEV